MPHGPSTAAWPHFLRRSAFSRDRAAVNPVPRGLDPSETAALLTSFLSVRDRAIAGLMLFSGPRSCEVLGLSVMDVDIARGWVRLLDEGETERRVPVDREVAALIQSYLLTDRPETDSQALFVVAKGRTRGQPLTAPGLRTIFRYHHSRAQAPACAAAHVRDRPSGARR